MLEGGVDTSYHRGDIRGLRTDSARLLAEGCQKLPRAKALFVAGFKFWKGQAASGSVVQSGGTEEWEESKIV